MDCSGQRNSICNDVGAFFGHTFNVRGFHFSSAATINELQACKCAASIISIENYSTKDAVSDESVCNRLNPVSIKVEFKWRRNIFESDRSLRFRIIDPWQ
tara:strand:- start:12668 stop:12967 length:300 start_codon:yes stop_codon:yes gene_type:complete